MMLFSQNLRTNPYRNKHFDKRYNIISTCINLGFSNSVLYRLAEVVWYSQVV